MDDAALLAGLPGMAGLVHATLGVGSAVAGVATAFLPERIGLERRMLGAAAALLLLSLPLLLVDGLPALAVTVALLGCAVAPLMIAVFSLAERVVAPARVASASACATPNVPASNGGVSKTPIGPFQSTVRAPRTASPNRRTVSGPTSNIASSAGIASRGTTRPATPGASAGATTASTGSSSRSSVWPSATSPRKSATASPIIRR